MSYLYDGNGKRVLKRLTAIHIEMAGCNAILAKAFRQVLTTSRPYAQIAAELNIPRSNLHQSQKHD
jgi:hypothetical protein